MRLNAKINQRLLFFTVCDDPPPTVLRGAPNAASDTAPYFESEMITYECNGDLVHNDGSTSGADTVMATCQLQGDGTAMWMIDTNFDCNRK